MTDWDGDERRWAHWLEQAQDGDEQAYRALLTELAGVIRAYVMRRLGRTDVVEDCVQESLLAIHQARHTYDPARPLRPWVFAIVRNRTIDVLRRLPPNHASTEAADGATSTPDLAQWIDADSLLGRLSCNLRDAVVMTKLMGFSTRECARHLGVSEAAVKVRVHRGLRKLRAMWDTES